MNRIIYVLLVSLLFGVQLDAQTEKQPYQSVGFLYNKEIAGAFGFTTNKGLYLSYEVGKIKTHYKTSFFRFNFTEIKSIREIKQSADISTNRSYRPFVLGKINSFYSLSLSWGKKRYYTEKARKKGVAVGLTYSFGPTLGIQKPYFLALRSTDPDNPSSSRQVSESYSEENASIFLDPTRILGASSFSKGLTDIKLVPGGHAAASLHLDIGTYDDLIKAIEIGAYVDVFPRTIPIMAESINQAIFANFFVGIQFGKRK